MICVFCHQEIKDDLKFCAICGRQIPRCPACGTVIRSRNRFCLNDGTAIPEDILRLLPEESDQPMPPNRADRHPQKASHSQEAANPASPQRRMQNDVPSGSVCRRFCLQCGKPCDNGQAICSTCQMRDASGKKKALEKPKTDRGTPQGFCVKCGSPCERGEALCRKCRHVQAGGKQTRRSGKKRTAAILISLILLLILLAGGIALYVAITGGREELRNQNEPEEPQSSFVLIDRSAPEEDAPETEDDGETSGAEIDEKPSETEEPDKPEISEKAEEPAEPEAPEESEVPEESAEPAEPEGPAEDEKEQAVHNFILNCDSKYFSADDLKGFDENMCYFARNGIYARSGRKFMDDTLVDYFRQFDWYHPTIEPDDFSANMFNVYQVANLDLIVAYEEERGFNQ